jgi:hypothetical protein
VSTNDWIAVGTGAGAFFLGLAAFIGILELRRGARARETALLLDLSLRWSGTWLAESVQANASESAQSVRALAEKPRPERTTEEREKWLLLLRVTNFLEAVGYLESQRSAIKIRDLERFWGTNITFVWETWEPSVTHVLRSQQSPAALSHLESLATKVRRHRDRRERRERLRALLRALLPGY